ncbi:MULTISPECIES: avidin/streptavidin family protein [unclassified Pseudomonas]|uniref:avidin/streptavidin family protein n=1 Tax=unclassified Pseudomonas TaxID=196821 RepID=UPI0021150E46|nr:MULTISPECIES: avidin/streptavidin family protein [unclassified Pseudomonas]
MQLASASQTTGKLYYCVMSLYITPETEFIMDTQSPANGLVFPMQRGPFQNNGASPWYSTMALGSPGQPLKLAIDSGTNISWVTSTLCPPGKCAHFAGARFDYRASSTFEFTDCLQRPYSFGPWGTMQVESASDVLTVPTGSVQPIKLFLAANYDGDQFKQLDWDGGIGLPCSSAYIEGRSSFLFQDLIGSGRLDPMHPYVAFDWNSSDRSGTCQMGAFDTSKTRGPGLFLPWSLYSRLPGVEYIWSTELKSYSVGGETLANNVSFALDSGSSQFKGDDKIMGRTLALIARGARPDVVLGFAEGEITLGADLYDLLVEEGPQKGQTVPQFAPLGLPDLVLVGSLVMEHCYTVYEYQVVQCGQEVYSLAPVGMWLFNRPDGPQIITRSSSRSFNAGPRPVVNTKVILPGPAVEVPATRRKSVAGTWKNEYGSVMTLAVTGNRIRGTYQSSTGSTGKYEVTGFQLGTPASPALSQPVTLAIEWHSTGDDPADPSWNWCSGLNGQMSVTPAGDRLQLSHLLVASSDFPGLAGQGTYIDKLTYRRVDTAALDDSGAEPLEMLPIEDALNGTWVADNGTTLELIVYASSQRRSGHVRGQLSTPEGNVEVSGFTDINALASRLALQSVSLTAAQTQESSVSSLCGSLELQGEVLNLFSVTSSATTPQRSYLATQVLALRFKRNETTHL